ncbi:MAG: hypothetical protein GX146_02585 [Myxococcales bacterium]|jgi:hypothetical protein|nr:hypothetical protein [Myxococcales bacterium]
MSAKRFWGKWWRLVLSWALTLSLALALALATIGCEGGGDEAVRVDKNGYGEEGDEGLPWVSGIATGSLALNNIYQVVPLTGASGVPMYVSATAPNPFRQIAPNAAVKVVISDATNNRYRVDHAGVLGWIHRNNLDFVYAYANNMPLSQTRINALARARQAMGFSYWWGNARWDPDGGAVAGPNGNAGKCTGNCPNCKHVATGGNLEFGADCSGFVSTIWGFPDFDPMTNPSNNGYVASRYFQSNPNWQTVTHKQVLPGDARVSKKHIYLVASRPNASGVFKSFECVGCSEGCKAVRRTLVANTDDSHFIRRKGW